MTAKRLVRISPAGAATRYWSDLWAYRELFFFLAWRDLLVRYRQAVLGIAWAVLRPALTLGVLAFVFGHLAKLPSGGVPYPLLVLAGLLPWQLFAGILGDAGASLVSNANLVAKVYFPRLIVPASSSIVSLVDFGISIGLFALLMLAYGQPIDLRVATVPLLTLLTAALAMGAGIWVAALNVRYRDFRFVVPLLLQLGLYASPVGFSSALVPPAWASIYALNPMVGIIDGFRWALLGQVLPFPLESLTLSLATTLALLASGVAYFRRTERTFADVI